MKREDFEKVVTKVGFVPDGEGRFMKTYRLSKVFIELNSQEELYMKVYYAGKCQVLSHDLKDFTSSIVIGKNSIPEYILDKNRIESDFDSMASYEETIR